MTGRKELQCIRDSKIGKGTTVWNYVNIYNSKIGENCNIGSYVEIGEAEVGDNTRIHPFCVITQKAKVGSNCFIAPGVILSNDRYPPRSREHWAEIVIGDNTVIGSNCVILACKIGRNCVIGSNSFVNRDVPDNQVWAGTPAKFICTIEEYRKKQAVEPK